MFAIGTTFDRVISNLAERMLPNKLKRLLFLSTFINYINGDENIDREMACKINQLLSLTHKASENILMPPNLIQNRVWSKIISRDEKIGETGLSLCDLNQIANLEVQTVQARYISNRIISNIPKSLRYGSNKEIRNDLMTLLLNLPRLHQAA